MPKTMKKKTLSLAGITLSIVVGCISILVCMFCSPKANAQFESGKWVAEYGGGSTPFRCVCVKNIFKTQCRVGDISSNLKLCNGNDTTEPTPGGSIF